MEITTATEKKYYKTIDRWMTNGDFRKWYEQNKEMLILWLRTPQGKSVIAHENRLRRRVDEDGSS